MRRVMAVLDRDKEYASRLAAYLNDQERIGFRTTALSSPEALKEYRKTARVEILLLSEDLAGKVHGLTEGAKVILLSDDGFVQGGDQRLNPPTAKLPLLDLRFHRFHFDIQTAVFAGQFIGALLVLALILRDPGIL